MTVGSRHGSHEGTHGDETTNLDVLAAEDVNSEYSDPVARDGGAECDESLGSCCDHGLSEGGHASCWGNEADLEENIFLEKTL